MASLRPFVKTGTLFLSAACLALLSCQVVLAIDRSLIPPDPDPFTGECG